jgi:hypothetical protein
MPEFTPIDPAELCRRWHQATVANDLRQWHSLSHLLAAEAAMCLNNKLRAPADDMAALSNLARQRALDLQPQEEMEPA